MRSRPDEGPFGTPEPPIRSEGAVDGSGPATSGDGADEAVDDDGDAATGVAEWEGAVLELGEVVGDAAATGLGDVNAGHGVEPGFRLADGPGLGLGLAAANAWIDTNSPSHVIRVRA